MKAKYLVIAGAIALGGIFYSYLRYLQPSSQQPVSQDQILATPTGTPQAQPVVSSQPPKQLIALPFSRPEHLTAWTHPTGSFSFAYNPSEYKDPIYYPDTNMVALNAISAGRSIFVMTKDYDGGSRHAFIQRHRQYEALDNTYEKEYLINNKPALFIYRVDMSSECGVGAIFYNNNQAILLGSTACEPSIIEPFLSTFRFTDSSSPSESYTCPTNGWVSCMPMLSEEGQRACSDDAINWYEQNCPNFEGIAY